MKSRFKFSKKMNAEVNRYFPYADPAFYFPDLKEIEEIPIELLSGSFSTAEEIGDPNIVAGTTKQIFGRRTETKLR